MSIGACLMMTMGGAHTRPRRSELTHKLVVLQTTAPPARGREFLNQPHFALAQDTICFAIVFQIAEPIMTF